ncbi:MAG: prepilin-type N-terminal cleavage/methylation domain-containing protein [Rhodocyclales bacterium GWA2_65_19]|nr:MAG: prepilin-type N-terminal cleavage/methylation domain-containing protein [Rhodocyclales bacterium GWA2_65_19]
MRSKQSGFTLVEIAIVLVIIGLLLGGVLKGQELINSAKVKNIISDMRNVSLFIYGYQDKYKALPGDDAQANAHTGGTTATCVGCIGNGIINGGYNSTTATEESFLFWQHVRLSNLAAGPTAVADANYIPKNADGGKIGIQSAANPVIANMTGTYLVCTDGVLGKFVKQIDSTLDDGETSTGSVRAVLTSAVATPFVPGTTAAVAVVLSSAIVDGSPYTVCQSF